MASDCCLLTRGIHKIAYIWIKREDNMELYAWLKSLSNNEGNIKTMKKLTSKLVSQASGLQKLDTIKSLILSNYGIDELDSEVLRQLKSLKMLDLSVNGITDFPDVEMKSLDTLDVSDNDIESMDFVKKFPNLKTLFLQGNAGLSSTDRLVALMMCPSLKKIDDCDASVYQRQIQKLRNKFEIQMKAMFEVLFEERITGNLIEEEIEKIKEEFQSKLREDPLFSNATSEAEIFILQKMSLEMIEEARSGRMTPSEATPGTPRSVRLASKLQSNGSTPRTPTSIYSKHYTSDYYTPTSHSVTPVNGRSPHKESSSSNTPNVKKRKRGASPDSGSEHAESGKATKRGRIHSPVQNNYSLVKKDFGKLPSIQDYDPIFFIRCHSENNDPEDEITKVWKCAMEPRADNPAYNTNMVATCGGHIVCLIDCKTGKVMKRYKDNNQNESFYTLAWTTVTLNTERQEKTNILAVAGQLGDIKLIHPTQFVMYATLEGHRNYISCLAFHPTDPTHLFSGASDGKIILWDIGVPDVRDYSVNFQKLCILQAPGTDALNLVINFPSKLLIAGCENSCYGWNIQNLKKVSREHDYEFVLPTAGENKKSDDSTTVDGLAQLSNGYVASKCVDEDVLSVWNVQDTLSSRSSKSKVRQVIPVRPNVLLQYKKLEVTYINIGASRDTIAVGDDEGNIHLYNLENITKKKSVSSDMILRSSRILEWPQLSVDSNMEKLKEKTNVIINSTCVSSDKAYLICGTDNNLVCIWKRCSAS